MLMNTSPDIITLGMCVMDRLVRVNRLPAPGRHCRVLSEVEVGGGMAANVAVALARLGVRCGLMAALGQDEMGQRIRRDLEAEHVDTRGVVTRAGAGSSHWLIFTPPDGPYMAVMFNLETCQSLRPDEIDEAYFRGARVFFTDLYSPSAAIHAARLAHQAGLKVACDVQASLESYAALGIQEPDVWAVLQWTDLFMPSVNGLLSLMRESDHHVALCRLMQMYPEMTIALTLAHEGSMICRGGEMLAIPAFLVSVVDTLGAGDVYHANLIYGLYLQNWDWERAGRFASAAAALKCTRVGARSAPTRVEVESFLADGRWQVADSRWLIADG